MSASTTPTRSQAELFRRIGDVPRERIVLDPLPGTATVADVLRFSESEPKRLCELVDGVLVEKAMGQWESRIGGWLYHLILTFLETHNLGVATPGDGGYRFWNNKVRFPDVAFVNWSRIPENADHATPLPKWAPNLAVEVLSPSNTRAEMQEKLEDYFSAGVELVWYVDPVEQIIEVFTAVDQKETLKETDTLTGGTVLPGFEVAVRQVLDSGKLRRPQ